MAVKQCGSRVVSDKIDFDTAEALNQNCVFDDPRSLLSVDLRNLKVVAMKMQWMQIITLVHESEPVPPAFFDLDRLALLIRLPVDRPDILKPPLPPLILPISIGIT